MTSYWWIQFKAWNNTSWSCANKTWILTDFFSVVSTSAMFNGIKIMKGKKRMRMLLDMSVLNYSIKNKNIVGSCQSKSLSQWPICFYFWFSFVVLIPFNNAKVETAERNSVKIHILLAHDQNILINTLNQIHQWRVTIL